MSSLHVREIDRTPVAENESPQINKNTHNSITTLNM